MATKTSKHASRHWAPRYSVWISTLCLLLASCSTSRFVPEGKHTLQHIRVSVDKDAAVTSSQLKGFVRQHPNSRWFGLWRVPMSPYMMQGRDTTRRFNRFLRRIGEAPVIYDSVQARQSAAMMQAATRNKGYLRATAHVRDSAVRHKMYVSYHITPGPRYRIRDIYTNIPDTALLHHLQLVLLTMPPKGSPYDIGMLDELRSRITQTLQERGYYKFNKEHITFQVDTTVGSHQVDMMMSILPYRAPNSTVPQRHTQYTIGQINYLTDVTLDELREREADQSRHRHIKHSIVRSRNFYDTSRHTYRARRLMHATDFKEGSTYSSTRTNITYGAMARMGGVMTTGVHFQETDSCHLDSYVSITTTRRHSVSLEPEATNSAGDFGAALVASYSNRNIFHGGEVLGIKARGAFEAIKGLKGYADQNYVEWGGEASISIPSFMLPFIRPVFQRRSQATTEFALNFNTQNRPEFHRRVFSGSLRYRWQQFASHLQHRLDLLDMSYVYMPWISETFKRDYLDDASSRNAILRYNYENLLIMKLGYQLYFTSRNVKAGSMLGRNAYTLRVAAECSGNVLDGITHAMELKTNASGSREVLGVAFAQYVKGDIDFSRSFRFDGRNSLALHGGLGIAFPYGNSRILPYEKRYFSGGANSVRGWGVRSLGPGTYKGNDGRIDFINQTGDMRLDLNAEFRTTLFWKIHTALFIDAGNIWTLREYEEQPGGQFSFSTFWRQIAVAYGLGFRLDFDYFVLRLDAGMKAVNPAYADARRHFPVIHPRFGRDFQLHFAVGLPF